MSLLLCNFSPQHSYFLLVFLIRHAAAFWMWVLFLVTWGMRFLDPTVLPKRTENCWGSRFAKHLSGSISTPTVVQRTYLVVQRTDLEGGRQAHRLKGGPFPWESLANWSNLNHMFDVLSFLQETRQAFHVLVKVCVGGGLMSHLFLCSVTAKFYTCGPYSVGQGTLGGQGRYRDSKLFS